MSKPFLRRRGAAYRLRIRVPADLTGIIGRAEIGRALGTNCPKTARLRASQMHARVCEAWYRIRAMPHDDDNQSRIIAELQQALTLAEQIADMERETAAIERENAEQETKLQKLRDVTERLKLSETFLENAQAMKDRAEGLVSRVEGIGRVVTQQKAAGKLAGEPLAALQNLLQSAGVVMRDRPAPTVLEFLEKTFIPQKRLAEDARRHMEGYVRLFAKIQGDRNLNTFTHADIVKWVGTLEKIRTSYGKGGKDHTKPIKTILAESKGKPTLNVTTIEKHMTHLKQFFVSAVRHHHFATSDHIAAMFADIHLSSSVPAAKERTIWPMAKLKELFASSIWTGTSSAASEFNKRHQPGRWVHLDAYWWLPVVALHTGCRLEEIAQLEHDDLETDSDGLLFVHITNTRGRRVKNLKSIRAIPVHPFLVELGFLTLFKEGKTGRIFPELVQAGRPLKWGGQYSEDFTAYRRSVGLYEPLMDFHAFRHNVVTELRDALGVDAVLAAQMVGHRNDPALKQFTVTNGYTHFSVRSKAEAFARLNWENRGVNFQHLRDAVAQAGGPRGRVRVAPKDGVKSGEIPA